MVQIGEKNITAIKHVTVNEPFFQGHFPDNPVMPGVLQIEALAQAVAILGLNKTRGESKNKVYLLGVDRCRFRRKVVPGDTLVLYGEVITSTKRSLFKARTKAFVGKELACEAVLMGQVTK